MDDIYDRFHKLLDSLDLVWLDSEAFAEAVHEKGAPPTGCCGFVDGTPRPIGTLSSFVKDENENENMTWHALGHWDENIVFDAKIES